MLQYKVSIVNVTQCHGKEVAYGIHQIPNFTADQLVLPVITTGSRTMGSIN